MHVFSSLVCRDLPPPSTIFGRVSQAYIDSSRGKAIKRLHLHTGHSVFLIDGRGLESFIIDGEPFGAYKMHIIGDNCLVLDEIGIIIWLYVLFTIIAIVIIAAMVVMVIFIPTILDVCISIIIMAIVGLLVMLTFLFVVCWGYPDMQKIRY